MGAYHNALREEGTREELLAALEKAWARIAELEAEVERLQKAAWNEGAFPPDVKAG